MGIATQFQISIEPGCDVVACEGRAPYYRTVSLSAMAVSINWCYCFFEILLAVVTNVTDAADALVAVADFCSMSVYLCYVSKSGICLHLSFRFRFLSNDW